MGSPGTVDRRAYIEVGTGVNKLGMSLWAEALKCRVLGDGMGARVSRAPQS